MKLLISISILAIASAQIRAAAPEVPAFILTLKSHAGQRYLTKVAEIPSSAVQVLQDSLGIQGPRIADVGSKFNSTDLVDGSLPMVRLIWATGCDGHVVVLLEKGGWAYHREAYVISDVDHAGKRHLEWGTYGFVNAANLDDFISLVRNGEFVQNP